MDYKPRPLCCRLHVLFAGIILVLSFSHINATTTSVVLYNSINVAVGQQATYNCSISGTGPDPSVAWKMTDTSGNPISVSFTVRDTGTDITSDGSLLSSNTFLVQSSHINQRLWCSVTDVGSASTSYQIFTHITETSATTANLGETCSPNVQCTPTNSECRNSVCVCRTGYRVNGNTCNLIGIGDSCAGSTCLPANSFCNQQSVCACNTGFYESSGSCLQKKNLGDTCTAGNNAMCGPDFSACSSLPPYTCVCQSGYTRSGSSCVLSSVGLGEVCVNPTRTCYTSNAHCEGTVCVCDAGYSVSGLAGNACALSPASVGQSCVNPTRTCSTSNTECDTGFTGTCRCSSGFVQSGTSCVIGTDKSRAPASLGEECANPARPCVAANSVCGPLGTCVCDVNLVQSGSTCVTSNVGLGDPCSNPTRTCFVANSGCDPQAGFTCQCTNGFVQSGSTCIVNYAYLSEFCRNPTRSCITADSVCSATGSCTCSTGFVQSGSTCISSNAGLGDSCSNPTRTCTTTNAVCNFSAENTCQCAGGYVQSGLLCVVSTASLGESCKNPTRSCITADSFCGATGSCTCGTGFVQSGSTCISANAGLGDSCRNPTRTCTTTSAVCDTSAGNTCQCAGGYVQSGLLCVVGTANIGEQCRTPAKTCVTTYSFCGPDGFCVCDYGYVLSGTACILNFAGLGDSCANPPRTCSVTNSVCDVTASSTCQCSSGFVRSGAFCVVGYANIGEPCTNPSRSCVTSNTVCAGTCVCASGFIQSGNACFLSTVTIGQSCTNPSRTCTTSNTVCGGSGTCVCANGFVQSGSTCITSNAALGDQCANPSRSCVTANAICGAQGFCVCGTGFVQSGSSCISSSANIGESCVNPPRSCVTGNTVCDTQQGACTCASGFVQSGSTCVSSSVGLGGQCVNPARTCTIANSVCGPQGTCECASGFTSSGSSCVISTATLGQACINPTRTCSVQYSVCREGTCQCDVGYILNGNVCQMPTIGQACAVNVGCQVTATGGTTTNPQCITGRCACPTGYYTYNNVCFEKSTTGATCDARVANSCLDDQASCTGTPATCTCNFGYTFVSGYCIIVNASDCPVNTQIPSTQPGAINAPDVYVGATCYQVDLGASNTMRCMDTKYQAALQSANWFKMPGYTAVVKSTGGFINGDISNTNMTVSNAQNVYGGNYICTLCYGSGFTRCTNSSQVQLLVKGAAIQSTSLTANPSVNVVRGGSFTFTCGTSPAGVATSFTFYKGSDVVQSGPSSTYFISSVQAVHDGSYTCLATNTNSQRTSDIYVIAAQYKPEYFLSGGGDTQTVFHDFANGDVQITCASMSANPPVSLYSFFNSSGSLLFSGLTPTYTVTGEQGYQRYSCTAANALGVSSAQFIEVTEPETNPGTGAATQDDGIGTGTIVAIVLGIIFLLLLIIIIIVCCCSYGWCRKKEKVQPEVIVEPPRVKPYIPRTIASATPSVRTAKDVGVMVHGVPVTEEFEPVYSATPRYHLKPAVNGGPIISLMDDSFEKPQPRPLQLPALDTQYLYTDGDQKRRHRKKRRKHSRRRHHEDRGPSEEDLVVVVDRHQYENGYE